MAMEGLVLGNSVMMATLLVVMVVHPPAQLKVLMPTTAIPLVIATAMPRIHHHQPQQFHPLTVVMVPLMLMRSVMMVVPQVAMGVHPYVRLKVWHPP